MKFPDLEDIRDEKALARLGCRAFAVSVFDHWLSEEESTTAMFTYAEAVEDGRMREFADIERRFLTLYSRLATGGVSLVRADGDLEPLKPAGRRFRELLIANVRERSAPRRKRVRFMDVYFHLWDTRVIGHWDLTDWFFCRSPEKIEGLNSFVREVGLHVLDRH
jgi:hypothetical protein